MKSLLTILAAVAAAVVLSVSVVAQATTTSPVRYYRVLGPVTAVPAASYPDPTQEEAVTAWCNGSDQVTGGGVDAWNYGVVTASWPQFLGGVTSWVGNVYASSSATAVAEAYVICSTAGTVPTSIPKETIAGN